MNSSWTSGEHFRHSAAQLPEFRQGHGIAKTGKAILLEAPWHCREHQELSFHAWGGFTTQSSYTVVADPENGNTLRVEEPKTIKIKVRICN